MGILKELSSNQNKFSDKLEKLSSRVDSIYDYDYEKLSSRVDSIYDYDQYVDNQSEGSRITEQFDQDKDFENYAYDAAQDDCADPPLLEDDCNESSRKKQKTDGSIFKNISEKFNPKEVTDHCFITTCKDKGQRMFWCKECSKQFWERTVQHFLKRQIGSKIFV